MSKAIQIYNDDGVSASTLNALCSSLAGFSFQMIDSDQVRNSNWEDTTSLLIMPGGRDVPYHEKLKGKGNQKIRRFVESGGRIPRHLWRWDIMEPLRLNLIEGPLSR